MIVMAKISGITPDWFTFMGICVGLSAVNLTAHNAFCVLHRDAALAQIHKRDAHNDAKRCQTGQ